MSTQEQATFIGQELERKLSIFKDYSIFYRNQTDGEDFYVDVQPKDGSKCITDIAMGVILDVVKNFDLRYFINNSISGKPTVSIY